MTDIVERLREHNEPPFDYIAHEAATEVERLREDMLEIMYLLTRGHERAQDIMDIVKPWAIQQVAYINARTALYDEGPRLDDRGDNLDGN
jgi:hypothetical protein